MYCLVSKRTRVETIVFTCYISDKKFGWWNFRLNRDSFKAINPRKSTSDYSFIIPEELF